MIFYSIFDIFRNINNTNRDWLQVFFDKFYFIFIARYTDHIFNISDNNFVLKKKRKIKNNQDIGNISTVDNFFSILFYSSLTDCDIFIISIHLFSVWREFLFLLVIEMYVDTFNKFNIQSCMAGDKLTKSILF